MAILLAGGLGYIGSNLTTGLLKSKEDVVIMDNLSNSRIGKASLIKSIIKRNFKVYIKDLFKTEDIVKIFKENQIESVIYLAEDKSNDIDYYTKNITMLTNLLTTMETFNCKRLIFISSGDIYKLEGEATELSDIVELSKNYKDDKEVNLKTIQEMILNNFFDLKPKENWAINILRVFNVSGVDETGMLGDISLKNDDIFSKIMRNEIKGEVIDISSRYITYDKTLVRDYIHINDLVEAIIKSLNYIRSNSNKIEVYNISSGKPTSENQVIKIYEIVSHKNLKVNNILKSPKRINYRIGNKLQAKLKLKFEASSTIPSIIQSNREFSTNYKQIIKDLDTYENDIKKQQKETKEKVKEGEDNE